MKLRKSGMSDSIIHTLEVQRLLCPMPVIRTQQAIKTLKEGDVLEVLCTDPGTLHDIPTWCRMYGHQVLLAEEREEDICFHIRVVAVETDETAAEHW